MFLAAGHNGLRTFSDDGLTWQTPEIGKEGEVYRAAAFGNGRCVIVGTFGGQNLMTSSVPGKPWETATRDAKYSQYFRGLAYGDRHFVASGGDPVTVGAAKPFMAISGDGVQWEENAPIEGKFILRRLAFGNGTWVGVGDRGRIASSTDAKAWKDLAGAKAIDTLVDVAFGQVNGGGLFVGVGLHGLRRVSTDGATWSEPVRGQEGEHLNSVIFTGSQFVAVGAGATYFSADAKEWKRVPNENAPTFFTFGAGAFVGTSWRGRLLYSRDAIHWKDVHKCEHPVETVAFGP
jgi:hypothetical protein